MNEKKGRWIVDSEQELSLLRLKLEHVQREMVALERKVGWLKEDVHFWQGESRFHEKVSDYWEAKYRYLAERDLVVDTLWEKEYYGLADEREDV